MSAYEEFAREKRAVDALLQDGYLIAGIDETLEGMEIRFEKRTSDAADANSDASKAKLLLLTADARKYVSNLIFSQQKQA